MQCGNSEEDAPLEWRAPARRRRAPFLAQGTLYPEVIESVWVTGSPSVTIKRDQARALRAVTSIDS